MPLSFPASPTVGDLYTAANKTWEWDGNAWIQVAASANIANDAVTTAKLATDAVTASKIADDAIVYWSS